MVEKKYEIDDTVDLLALFGHQDKNLKIIEDLIPVRLIARGNLIKIIGSEEHVRIAESVFNDLIHSLERKKSLSKRDIETTAQIARLEFAGQSVIASGKDEGQDLFLATNEGTIRAKSAGQQNLLEAFKKNDIIFAIGPAGTGKTFLAVAMAVHYLKNKRVKKIVLARPAVEAGESLGYLPGDFREKIDPYLKPLYDALEEMMPQEMLKKYLMQGNIEVLPLAYMRGRTLNNAFVILDEAQNSTFTQMKMFLTRLGFNAKAVITGDITQIDLPHKKESGLVSSIRILENIKGIAFIYLDKKDVVRHALVKEIIDAYYKYDNGEGK